MKSLVLLVSSVVAFSAFAGEYSVSKVYFQSAATWVKAENVCRAGNVLKHKTKASVQVAYCDDNDANCTYVTKALVQPVVSTAQRCAKFESDSSGGDCLVWETYTLNQASVKIYTYADSDSNEFSVTGMYTIPACKTGGGVAN